MKSRKILYIVVTIGIILVGGYLGFKKLNIKEKPGALEINKLDNIEKYEYSLFENKSSLYKEYFEELKVILNKEELEELEYAKAIGKIFAADFYSLDEKITNNDIGGLDFILPSIVENFSLKASDTIYYHVQNNIDGKRKQELPKVKSITIKDAKKEMVQAGETNDKDGYIVMVSIEYENDLGFPKDVQLKMVHKDIKLYIVEVK